MIQLKRSKTMPYKAEYSMVEQGNGDALVYLTVHWRCGRTEKWDVYVDNINIRWKIDNAKRMLQERLRKTYAMDAL